MVDLLTHTPSHREAMMLPSKVGARQLSFPIRRSTCKLSSYTPPQPAVRRLDRLVGREWICPAFPMSARFDTGRAVDRAPSTLKSGRMRTLIRFAQIA